MAQSSWMTRQSVRELDRRAIDEFHLAGIVLMENAGRGVVDVLLQSGLTGPVVVCVGKGNNGGDGLVVARHLDNRGLPVRVLLFCDPSVMRGDALRNLQVLQASAIPWRGVDAAESVERIMVELSSAEWIVDGLLGTGTRGEIRPPLVAGIQAINRAQRRVLAIDLPSGLDCDTGQPLNACVRAERTATLVAAKQGFQSAGAGDWTGEVHVVDIGVPRKLLETHDWRQA